MRPIKKNTDPQLKPFARIKNPFWKIDNWKDILQMAIPIFIQLSFNVIIAQINIIAINHYQNGVYADAVSKAVLTYVTLQFIPTLIASGSLVVCGNLIGQGRTNEIGKVIITGIIINFAITSFIFIFVQVFASQILDLMNAGQFHEKLPNGKTPKVFTISYYRLLNIQLLVLSLSQVWISGLQAIKKNIHVTIGAIASNIVDLIFVTLVLFAFNLDPIWSALSICIAGVVQLIYMLVMNLKLIDYKTHKGRHINFKMAKETFKVGLPIALEMGIWSLCNFATGTAIAHLVIGQGGETSNPWIVLHRSINSISQFSFAFMQAMGTVTAVMVSRKIGEGKINEAYQAGISCWKTAMYASIFFGAFMLSFAYLLLLMFNHTPQQIIPWGFSLMAIISLKLIVDTVNMTLLRACWAVGDLWYPLIISIITMGIGMVGLPMMIVYGFKVYEGMGLILIYLGVVVDPLLRSIIYSTRWIKGTWTKYAKQIS
ncbi:MATE family efflux transporter [Williamsoniiplasma lucivorax]|uniref:MATE family efflux transporter n=1 Tax=Williamsoniiplasma lucivorax TaxID=209274 RepID=A0A2S5REI9_9MOLU|nr:MATE family efflux transporter [Williamsoniiplasma lucivorax]PPE05717.1 hypothetical protein ELUCI_v1c00030 [Williamsoniiplasma lucivorax]